MNIQLSTISPKVTAHNGKAVTTSQDVADYFGKRHDDVLKKIRNLDCSSDFTTRNFTVCFKNNKLQNGKPQPYYEMTKDGFVFLVMGFTGKKAAQFKEAYIAEFNRMESELHSAPKYQPKEGNSYTINFPTAFSSSVYSITTSSKAHNTSSENMVIGIAYDVTTRGFNYYVRSISGIVNAN